MKYITLSELCITIRNNFWKIPHNVDFVISIPRSGTICGSIISEFLNVPLIDINSFVCGVKPNGGGRLRHYNKRHSNENGDNCKKRVLVVDDTIFNGTSKRKAQKQLEPFIEKYDFIYMAVYLEGPAKDAVDINREDVRKYTNGFKQVVLYEWNIFHHNEDIMLNCIYDIDGVLCVNPPDERNEEEYLKYIKNAVPLFTPSVKVGEILTYRLVKNEEITRKWLKDNGIEYGKLSMFNAQSWEERNAKGVPSEVMKGVYYKNHKTARLFVESDDFQARRIFEISGKPVYCVESNKLYSKD